MDKHIIKNFYYRISGFPVRYSMKKYRKELDKINAFDLSETTDQGLLDLFTDAGRALTLKDMHIPVFAAVREAAGRILGMRPFDVQLLAALVINRGKLAEMKTGEGKTLAAVFPAIYHALSGKGVHVLTANDYLAERDAAWMGPLYRFFGLTVSHIAGGMDRDERRKAYRTDITYLTAKQAGFDFLRDQIRTDPRDHVQRGFNFCIVDEADNTLIDEARIPLVIAGESLVSTPDPYRMAELVSSMKEGTECETDDYRRNVFLTDRGIRFVEDEFGCGNLYDTKNRDLLTGVNLALQAEFLLKRDRDYLLRQDRVELVDEFTGRVMDDRRWPDGIQRAVEAKEGVPVQEEGRVLASITLQHFLEQYPVLAAMTATACPAARELHDFYGLETVVIPPNRHCRRVDEEPLIFLTGKARDRALVSEILRVHASGQPVLVGTATIADSERIAGLLAGESLSFNVLNAKNHAREAAIIARAGEPGAITISTNMAGRGTDIRLGGKDGEQGCLVKELGGLYVIGTNLHESRRIDDQLRGRAGRQGDPGISRFFVSLEDDLMKRYNIRSLIPEQFIVPGMDDRLESPVVKRETARLQRIVEGQNYEIRKTLHRYSDYTEKQRKQIAARRDELFHQKTAFNIFAEDAPVLYRKYCKEFGKQLLDDLERSILIYHLDRNWSRHLEEINHIRESIHLQRYAGNEPLQEFMVASRQAFDQMQNRVVRDSIRTFREAEITADGIRLEKVSLKGPDSTWTYLLNDNPFSGIGLVSYSAGTVAAAPIIIAMVLMRLPLILRSKLKGLRKKK